MILKKIEVANIEAKTKTLEILDIENTAEQLIDRLMSDQINALELYDGNAKNALVDPVFMKAIKKSYRNLHAQIRLKFEKRTML